MLPDQFTIEALVCESNDKFIKTIQLSSTNKSIALSSQAPTLSRQTSTLEQLVEQAKPYRHPILLEAGIVRILNSKQIAIQVGQIYMLTVRPRLYTAQKTREVQYRFDLMMAVASDNGE